MVKDAGMNLNFDEMFLVNFIYFTASGVIIEKELEEKVEEEVEEIKEENTKENKKGNKNNNKNLIKKIYRISVPERYETGGRSLKVISGKELADLFYGYMKEEGLKNRSNIKGCKVEYKIRKEVWDYDRYQDKKAYIIERLKEKGFDMSSIIEELDRRNQW